MRAGRRWTIGRPAISWSGAQVTLDYSAWLRPGETLEVAADTFYGGAGINAGKGVECLQIVDTGTVGPGRYGSPAATPQLVEVLPGGTAYRVTFDAAPSGPLGYVLRYAFQAQDMSTLDPLHYGHRGLLRTNWSAPSAILQGETLRRWLPSWEVEVIV